MLSLLFRSLHVSTHGNASPAPSTCNRSSSSFENGASRTTASATAPSTRQVTQPTVWLGAPPAVTEKSACLRAAVTAAGSRRCSRSSSSSNACRCVRPPTRSAVLLPSFRPVLRALPSVVALCDEERGSSSSFFSSFKFFDRQRRSAAEVGDDSATATVPYSDVDDTSTTRHSGAAMPRRSSIDTYTAGDMAAGKFPAENTLRPPVGDTTSAVSAQHEESSEAAAGATSHKHARPPSAIPIPYEQFSREWMGVSGQDNFDGFKLEATRQVNKVLTANHTFHLGTTTKEGGCSYSFGPTLVIGEPDEAAQQEGEMPKFFGMARLSSDGFLQARFIRALSKTSDIKFNSNASLSEGTKDKAVYELCLDKVGNDWATNLKLAWQGTWIVNGLFSQVITPKLQMGGELTWVTANGLSMASVGGRYAFDENNIGSCQFGVSPDFSSPVGLTTDVYSGRAQYVRKVTDRLSVGTEIECAHPDMSSSLKLGWQYLFRQARVQGTIDTAGRVAMYTQDYNGFAVSGLIDYWHGDYKFGFQMNVLPPPTAADHPIQA